MSECLAISKNAIEITNRFIHTIIIYYEKLHKNIILEKL